MAVRSGDRDECNTNIKRHPPQKDRAILVSTSPYCWIYRVDCPPAPLPGTLNATNVPLQSILTMEESEKGGGGDCNCRCPCVSHYTHEWGDSVGKCIYVKARGVSAGQRRGRVEGSQRLPPPCPESLGRPHHRGPNTTYSPRQLTSLSPRHPPIDGSSDYI